MLSAGRTPPPMAGRSWQWRRARARSVGYCGHEDSDNPTSHFSYANAGARLRARELLASVATGLPDARGLLGESSSEREPARSVVRAAAEVSASGSARERWRGRVVAART